MLQRVFKEGPENGLLSAKKPPHPLHFRRAEPPEAKALSAIARQSKAHWGYPKGWLKLWEDQLTVEPRFIEHNHVEVAEGSPGILAFFAIDEREADLAHFWVTPKWIGHGVGRALFERLVLALETFEMPTLSILSDPHAEGFYKHMGAVRVGEHPGVPVGRWLPLLRYTRSQLSP